MTRRRSPKQIALRLASGDCREALGHGLPPHIKDGLKSIARDEGKSLSWLLEEILIDYFKLPRPKYIPRKKQDK